MAYLKNAGLELSTGNRKIGNDTVIFNMTSAMQCPSYQKGLCKLGKACYALKAERLYPGCRPYRDRQNAFWNSVDATGFLNAITPIMEGKKKRNNLPKYFRFNESGDFQSQEDVSKLSTIAFYLRKFYGIITYGYTARKDLDFTNVHFMVKGSGHDKGNNGMTIARHKKTIAANMLNKTTFTATIKKQRRYFKVCQMDCKKCDMCKIDNGLNIVFPLH